MPVVRTLSASLTPYVDLLFGKTLIEEAILGKSVFPGEVIETATRSTTGLACSFEDVASLRLFSLPANRITGQSRWGTLLVFHGYCVTFERNKLEGKIADQTMTLIGAPLVARALAQSNSSGASTTQSLR